MQPTPLEEREREREGERIHKGVKSVRIELAAERGKGRERRGMQVSYDKDYTQYLVTLDRQPFTFNQFLQRI